jgi:glycosyltransferase involved in cell wall biosynthesis
LSFFVILCIAVVGVQLIYLILFLVAFYKVRPLSTKNTPPVSVIVCAHDEEVNLRELIPLLLAQDYPEFEVIVVEDRSNDGTYDYLLQATQEDVRLKMVRVVHKPEYINGKKFGLTLGIRAAKHDCLLFTDADCRPISANWIRRMTELYDDKAQIVLGFSPYRRTTGVLNSFIRFESLLTGIQYIGFALLGKPYMGVGRNLVYSKSLFLENKGFNNYLGVMGGDDDLFINNHATNVNTRICIGGDTVVISSPKRSWSEFMRQKLRHLAVGKKYKFRDKMMLGGLMITWLATWFIVPFGLFTEWWIVLALQLVLRTGLLIWLLHRASLRLNAQFELWKTPILDFIFSFYYLVTGLRALVVKRIRWKNN